MKRFLQSVKQYFVSIPGLISITGFILLLILTPGSIFSDLIVKKQPITLASISIVDIYMSVIISLIILCASLWIILSKKYTNDSRNWAFGIVGTIVGHWIG